MMQLKTVIVDDERIARNRLADLLKDLPYVQNVVECRTAKEALLSIKTIKPDLVFMDVNLKGANGLDIWNNLDENTPVLVVVSAHHSYGPRAFEAQATDYLLKPFDDTRFFKTISKVLVDVQKKNRVSQLKSLSANTDDQFVSTYLSQQNVFPIKKGNKMYFIDFSSIICFISSGHYIEMVTPQTRYKIRDKIGQLESALEGTAFLRINRSTIVNIKYIKSILYSSYGELDIRLEDNQLLRISRSYKTSFLIAVGLNS